MDTDTLEEMKQKLQSLENRLRLKKELFYKQQVDFVKNQGFMSNGNGEEEHIRRKKFLSWSLLTTYFSEEIAHIESRIKHNLKLGIHLIDCEHQLVPWKRYGSAYYGYISCGCLGKLVLDRRGRSVLKVERNVNPLVVRKSQESS